LNYINYNGSVVEESSVKLSMSNRAFRYGDSLFETIRIIDGIPVNLKGHFDRLSFGINTLQYSAPFSMNELSFQITDLALQNSIIDGRVRVTLYRRGKGTYTPEINEVSYLIEMEAISQSGFRLNEKGISLGIYEEVRKPTFLLSNLKTGNSLCYVLAGVYNSKNGFDDCLLLNDEGNIVEAISSNIFLIKNEVLYTPSASEGCVLGTMRKAVLQIGSSLFENVKETSLDLKDLKEADEVFLTNAISGMIWVGNCRDTKYSCNSIKLIFGKLEESITGI